MASASVNPGMVAAFLLVASLAGALMRLSSLNFDAGELLAVVSL